MILTLDVTPEEATFVQAALQRRGQALAIALATGKCVIKTTIGDEQMARRAVACHTRLFNSIEKQIPVPESIPMADGYSVYDPNDNGNQPS